MTAFPKVSIITVCLNSGSHIEGAIRSVTEQTYGNIEYIVIDGGSTDNTSEVLRRYSGRINRIVAEKDRGVFDAMNKGIGMASGEIIYFLNSDDRLHNANTIENAVRFFMQNKEVDFIYGNLEVFDPSDGFSYIERYPHKVTKWLFISRTIAQPGSFFKADCFKRCGYFDINYRFAADHDWYLKAVFLKKLKAMHIEEPISVFRLGGLSNNYKYTREYFSERRSIEKKYLSALELLYTDFLRSVKMFLGRRLSKSLHRVKVSIFK